MTLPPKSSSVKHTMPITVIRGMSSLPPKKGIVDRFNASGKARLILLIVTDLDPPGRRSRSICSRAFGATSRIDDIEAIKVALTIDQVREHNLPPSMQAKKAGATKSSSPSTARALTNSTPCSRRT